MRASRSAPAILVSLLALVACAGCSTAAVPTRSETPSAHAVDAASSVRRALASCGLSGSTDGVTVGAAAGSRGLLHLVTDQDGRPTGIDRLDATCTLTALGLPADDRALLRSTSIEGGYQTVSWSGYSATWRFQDTLTFDIRVYAAR